jgi:putative ABC transport system permease protein
VPSKIVKLMEVRAVSAGRRPVAGRLVSTNSARYLGHSRLVPVALLALAGLVIAVAGALLPAGWAARSAAATALRAE